MLDLHIHTSLSFDAKGEFDEHVACAIKSGLKIIGFTEHWDFDRWDPAKNFIAHKESERLVRGYTGAIEVLFGAELAYHPHFEQDALARLSEVEPDYILGSVHEIDGLMVAEALESGQYFERHGKKGFGLYFEQVARFAETGKYDIFGHLDVVKRFSVLFGYPFHEEAYKSIIEHILSVLVKRGKSLEINTSGLRQPPGAPYPSLKVVQWFFECGGKYLTIGSDSHHPETVGQGCDQVIADLIGLGITDLTIYRKRTPVPLNVIGEPKRHLFR